MRLLQYSDIENAHDNPGRIADLAGTIEALRDRPGETLVCGTGDNLAPGVLPLITSGEIALEFFETIVPDVETFGNHDFDFGPERAVEIVRQSPQRWLSANVQWAGDPLPGVDPWAIETVGDERVGLFGLTDPTTPSIGGEELSFAAPIPAAKEAVEALQKRDVDYVVALSHLGRADDRLAAAVDVDAVLGGHVHSPRIERVAGAVLTRPGSGGGRLLEIDLPEATVTEHDVTEGPRNETLAARYRDRSAEAGLDSVIGHVEEPISRTDAEAFRGESRVGNFVADAYRWAAERVTDGETPVIGLQNSGGIRTGPPLSGAVTVADLIGLVPFDEPLVVVELSGERLRRALGEAAETPGFGEADWWHAHVSGAQLVYDHAADELESATVGGQPIDDAGTYRLAVSAFLLETDVEFPTLSDMAVYRQLDTQYEILIEYAESTGIAPKIEGRITRNGACSG